MHASFLLIFKAQMQWFPMQTVVWLFKHVLGHCSIENKDKKCETFNDTVGIYMSTHTCTYM